MYAAYRDINDINDIICEFARVVRSEVVPTTLNEEHLAAELGLEGLKRARIRANVFTNGGVWTATGLDRENARRRESLILDEELLILARKDVVRDRRCVSW